MHVEMPKIGKPEILENRKFELLEEEQLEMWKPIDLVEQNAPLQQFA